MFPLTVDVPELFRLALENRTSSSVCTANATTPAELFGRGLNRMAAGDLKGARADLQAAQLELEDPCRIELAQLALRERSGLAEALKDAASVVDRAPAGSILAARATHVTGVLQLKTGELNLALETLSQASKKYDELSCRLGHSQVQDSIGMAHAELGRLDRALEAYSLSLADKTLLGDLEGQAIALGNLGRVNLQSLRFQEALDYFQRDLELATRLDDKKSQAQLHDHLGQAWLGLEDFAQAASEFEQSLALAVAGDYRDIEFFALKDRALLRIAQGSYDDAEAELDEASRRLTSDTEPDLHLYILAARGEIFAARKDSRASETLDQAARGFSKLRMASREIGCRLAESRALVQAGQISEAENCLLRAQSLASADGYARHLKSVREALAALGMVEKAPQEHRRLLTTEADGESKDYLQRELLGHGQFGDMYRAIDLTNGREVAFKRLHLEHIYDVEKRQLVWESARVELEVATRVRHPCLARVWAIGMEPGGGAYIVEEFVRGRSLADLMSQEGPGDVRRVLRCLELVADALAALHVVDVVHRDVKPANIIIRDDGQPVLIDLGIAQVGRFSADTISHAVGGTLDYMAPEQAQGNESIDGKADLYALGVIAYQWLAGELPLTPQGKDFNEQADDLARRSPKPLSAAREDLSPDLQEFILSLLAKKPRGRPANAQIVAQKFRELAHPQTN